MAPVVEVGGIVGRLEYVHPRLRLPKRKVPVKDGALEATRDEHGMHKVPYLKAVFVGESHQTTRQDLKEEDMAYTFMPTQTDAIPHRANVEYPLTTMCQQKMTRSSEERWLVRRRRRGSGI